MAADYALRAAVDADVDAIFEVFSQPNCRSGMSADPFTSAAAAKAWLDRIGDGVTKTVATINDVPIALAILLRGPDGRRHVASLALFVHDDHQRRGVGTLLMTDLLTRARADRRIRRAELYVDCLNFSAIALYLKFGFVVEGRHESFAISGETYLDMYTMAKIL